MIGAILVPAVFLVGRSLFTERVALIAASLVTFSPSLTEYAATARPYSMLPLFTLISVYALTKALRHSAPRMWILYGASTLALLYTHNWSVLIVFAEWVAVGIEVARRRDRKRIVREWLVTQAIIGIAYLPWLSTLAYQAKHAGHSPSDVNISEDFIFAVIVSVRRFLDSTILAPAQLFAQQARESSAWIFAIPLVLLPVAQLLFAKSGTRTPSSGESDRQLDTTAMKFLLVVPCGAFFAALLLSPRSELMIGRCLVALAPLVLLALANWLGRLRQRRFLTAAGAAMIAVFFLTYFLSLSRILPTSRSNARELAGEVGKRTHPADLVVVSPEWLASSFNRYYTPGVEQIDYPRFYREGAVDFTGFLERFQNEASVARARARFREARNDHRRVWLVLDARKIREQTPQRLREMLSSKSYGLVSYARTVELRHDLDSLYGTPDTLRVTGGRIQRYEFFTALLYLPR
jgi:hypothetical protein